MNRQDIFSEISKKMRQDFEEIRNNVKHYGEAGAETERILIDFLNDHLPKRFNSTSGFIIDKNGDISSHCDVIVYDALNCPIYRRSDRATIIPIDNVALVFEVKSKLTNNELASALKKLKSINNLIKTPDKDPKANFLHITGPYTVIFAFETDLSEAQILTKWNKEIGGLSGLLTSANMIAILDVGIFTQVSKLPGETNVVPSIVSGLPPAPVGAKIGLYFLPYKDRALDGMLRILLLPLMYFRPKIDHPGYDFSDLGDSPVIWVTEFK